MYHLAMSGVSVAWCHDDFLFYELHLPSDELGEFVFKTAIPVMNAIMYGRLTSFVLCSSCTDQQTMQNQQS